MTKESMGYVDFGLNLDKFSPEPWKKKVEEFRQAVEKYGAAQAKWGCEGRTRHHSNALMLKDELPQYKWEISYDSYLCIARKK